MKAIYRKAFSNYLYEKIGLLLFLSLLNLITPKVYPTNITVSDTIKTDTTWSGVDTVIVTGDLVIDSTAKLIIEPGLVIDFKGWYRLTVHGIINAIGALGDTIIFTRSDTTDFHIENSVSGAWRGIILENKTNTADSFVFRFCKIEYIKDEGDNLSPATINYLDGYQLNIERSLIKDNRGGIKANGANSVYIDSCTFANNNKYKYYYTTYDYTNKCFDIYSENASNINITYNTFVTSTVRVIYTNNSSDISIIDNSITAIARINEISGVLWYMYIQECEGPVEIRKNSLIKNEGAASGINITASEAIIDSNTFLLNVI